MSQDETNPEELLNDLSILNSELRRYVRRGSFSTHLSGRFYENNSLESFKARARRISEMKAKRKQLEKSLLLEEKKIKFLEEELRKKVESRKNDEERKKLMAQAATMIQAVVRRKLAMNKVELMKVEEQIMNYVVLILQARFRGWQARERVKHIRLRIAQRLMEESASIRIQCLQRRRIARRKLFKRRTLLQEKRNAAACIIQAHVRGYKERQTFVNVKKHRAAITIQCMARVSVARERMRKRKLAVLEKKKDIPKRLHFHQRTYSIYSVDVRSRDHPCKRSLSDISSSSGIHRCNERTGPCSDTTTDRSDTVTKLDHDSIDHPTQHVGRKKNLALTLDENVILAQHRASMRVAKLKVLKRLEKEKEELQVALRKEELARLEAQRRVLMAQEEEIRRKIQADRCEQSKRKHQKPMDKHLTPDGEQVTEADYSPKKLSGAISKQRGIKKAKNDQTAGIRVGKSKDSADAYEHHKSKDGNRTSENAKNQSMDLSYCWDDGDFEEDVCENENDLSS